MNQHHISLSTGIWKEYFQCSNDKPDLKSLRDIEHLCNCFNISREEKEEGRLIALNQSQENEIETTKD